MYLERYPQCAANSHHICSPFSIRVTNLDIRVPASLSASNCDQGLEVLVLLTFRPRSAIIGFSCVNKMPSAKFAYAHESLAVAAAQIYPGP
ncbi:MAG TPA: hypothetical protein VKG86_06265 [Terracidiphilus sp.]|nr:hypothetical protein [Terracidiphilus sp.]